MFKLNHLMAIDFDVSDVGFEDCWLVRLRKLIFAEDKQQTSFAARAIANYHQFLAKATLCSHAANTNTLSQLELFQSCPRS